MCGAWGLAGAGGGRFPLTPERNGGALVGPGSRDAAGAGGWTPAARAGLCVPGRGQRRPRGSEPADAPRVPRAHGAQGQLLLGGSAGWEPAVPWTRAPCAMGCPSTCQPFCCWGSYARLATAVPRGCPLAVPLAEPGRWLQPNGGQQFSFHLSPQGWLFVGAARDSPRFPGNRGECGAGLVLARLHGAQETRAGRPQRRPAPRG